MEGTKGVEVDQISAERILEEVYKRRKVVKPSTKVDVLDLEELRELQGRKRTEFEGYLKRNRLDIGQWIRYAQFEVEQHDIRRARSVFERALLVDSSHIPLWIRYIDTEIKLKNINHARNLLNRAVGLLPRVDKLWYKYLVIEESLGNVEIVRTLFTKWTSLEPSPNAWDSFINFEMREKNWTNVREVFAMYVLVHPQADTWLRWVSFEVVHGDPESIRKVYSLALDTIVSMSEKVAIKDEDLAALVVSFANWEATQQEYQRCKQLYVISVQRWPNNELLKKGLLEFDKRFGDSESIEHSVIQRRRRRYEEDLQQTPNDYDTRWLYLDLIQTNFKSEMLDCLEESVSNTQPRDATKTSAWKRYIYLWVRYLVYVELEVQNIDLCRRLYQRLIDLIPHRKFTFSKVWFMYSQFELRNGELTSTRKIMGNALGICPKPKTFKLYINMEIKLKEFDRVRKLYEKFIEYDPSNMNSWIAYAELEVNLGDYERAIGIYELSLMPDIAPLSHDSRMTLMQKYIDYVTDEEEFGKARELYERYLQISEYAVEVWVKYALYESDTPTIEQVQILREEARDNDDEEEEVEFTTTDVNRKRSRQIFERALDYFKNHDEKENRAVVLEAFKSYEEIYGTPESQAEVQRRLPSIIKNTDLEENGDNYVFPDDEETNTVPNISKLQALAKKWEENSRKNDSSVLE